MRPLILAAAVLALAACSRPAEKAPPPAPAKVVSDAPAGQYRIDLSHTSVNFRVSHLGFSNYTARFTNIDGTLDIDPANPAAARLDVTIDPASIQTNYPLDDIDFDKKLAGPEWLDAAKFPKITYRSTKVEPTGPNTAKVTGDLTLHGVTKPVVLDVTFNGGYASFPYDPGGSRIGFSAKGVLMRSEFGLGFGVPEPGSNIGVSDAVEIIVETEMFKPKADA